MGRRGPKPKPFDSHVDRSGGPDACWPWTGSKTKDGYGVFWATGADGSRRTVYAHRYALKRKLSHRLGDLHALHTCDNPPCCNEAHLFPGTPLDNAHDRDAKGRQRALKGEAHGAAKLEAWQVVLIWEIAPTGLLHASGFARAFGVAESTVNQILRGETWKEKGAAEAAP